MVDWANIDWQIVANIATSLAFLFAIWLFIWEIRSNRKDRAFSVFLRMVDYYGELVTKRKHRWKLIKEKVESYPKTSKEISDKTSTLDYLLERIQQKEPLYSVEHGLLEDEIKSLNLLDGLCKYASNDKQMALILKVSCSSDISYYQNRLDDLLLIRNKEKQARLFSVPHYSHLTKFHVSDYFEDMQHHH
jgi:hypothetical protein